MTTLNSALNFNFASSEASRLAYAERGAEEVVAAQLRQAAEQSKFTVGATITAKYQYKVAEDGSLIPLQTQVTTDAPDDALRHNGRRNRQSLRQEFGERQPSFKDLSRPHAELSPADEIALFADAERFVPAPGMGQPSMQDVQEYTVVAAATTANAEVIDESGEQVEAEILTRTPSGPEAKRFSFLPSIQFSVASLYARNNEVVYNATPIAQLAA